MVYLPFLRLLDFGDHSLTFILMGFGLKMMLYSFAFAKGTEYQKLVVLLVFLFDLFHAALVGIGRYHTGLEASVSSRYQYQPMLCVTIALAVLLQNLSIITRSLESRLKIVGYVFVILLGLYLSTEWKSDLRGFTNARGTNNRFVILQDIDPPQFGVAGIPFLKTETARELVRKYILH